MINKKLIFLRGKFYAVNRLRMDEYLRAEGLSPHHKAHDAFNDERIVYYYSIDNDLIMALEKWFTSVSEIETVVLAEERTLYFHVKGPNPPEKVKYLIEKGYDPIFIETKGPYVWYYYPDLDCIRWALDHYEQEKRP